MKENNNLLIIFHSFGFRKLAFCKWDTYLLICLENLQALNCNLQMQRKTIWLVSLRSSHEIKKERWQKEHEEGCFSLVMHAPADL